MLHFKLFLMTAEYPPGYAPGQDGGVAMNVMACLVVVFVTCYLYVNWVDFLRSR
jgi:hypothetical protein